MVASSSSTNAPEVKPEKTDSDEDGASKKSATPSEATPLESVKIAEQAVRGDR